MAFEGYKITKISGWANYPVVETRLYRPERVRELFHLNGEQSWLARGLGRSYGDAAVNDQGGTVLMTRLNRFLSFDERTGVLHAEAGVSLEQILRIFVPRGWFLPVTPGTKYVTLGGAIASDVHGKNHHRDGSIARFVEEIELLKADGQVCRCSPGNQRDLFQATLGGNGLTGIILSAKIKLMPVETAYIVRRTNKTRSLEETFALFEQWDGEYQYSVAWIDGFARGARLGRGVGIFGNHAPVEQLGDEEKKNPLKIHNPPRVTMPCHAPGWLLNKSGVHLYNFLYHTFRKKAREQIVHYDAFFYPLDRLQYWNRLYGSRGFFQWQCVFPPAQCEAGIQALLEWLAQHNRTPYLAVLKKMGPGQGWLSFPVAGYTLALDFPRQGQPESWIHALNEIVLKYGGRIYLTKDALLPRDQFEAMYPDLPRWKRLKAQIDPQNKFASHQARRLGLLN